MGGLVLFYRYISNRFIRVAAAAADTVVVVDDAYIYIYILQMGNNSSLQISQLG